MDKDLFKSVKVEKVETIEEGKYEGKIVDINRDMNEYDYMRYDIYIPKIERTLQVSFPTKITFMNDGTPSSNHAKFLSKVGYDFVSFGEKTFADIVEQLKGKELSFLIQNVEKKNGTFSEIVKDSIKLI